MTKAELEKWIQENPKNGWGNKVIDGSYEFIEVDNKWKIVVEGNVNVGNMGLVELPNVFHSVSGNFDCSENQITSLKHCPDSVKELHCYNNQLISLKYCPNSVEKLNCENNQLTSLEHCPDSVETLNCYNNQLISLKHCSDLVEKLNCSNNQLTSLEYCPSSVEILSCSYNELTNLEYIPLNLKFFLSDFSSEEYKAYVIETKDNLEKQASDERVEEIEELMELGR